MQLGTLADATLVVAFVFTLWPRPDARALRSYLTPVVGTLAVTTLSDIAAHVPEPWRSVLRGLAIIGLFVQPYFLLRLVSVLQPVAPRLLRCMAVGAGAAILLVLLAPRLPVALADLADTVAVVALTTAEGYGAVRLWLGGGKAFGAARQRAYMLALASLLVTALLVATVALAMAHAALPPTITSVSLALMSLLYALAGATPAWLRHAWQMPVLYRYYEAELQLRDRSELTILAQLLDLAMQVVGALAGESLQRDGDPPVFGPLERRGADAILESPPVVAGGEGDEGGAESTESENLLLARVWDGGPAEVARVGRAASAFAPAVVRRVVVVPVRARGETLALLRLYTPVHGLFLHDDLLMLEALASHAGSRMLNARAFQRERQVSATLRDANRALEAASAAKSDFLSGMSHELRTPLNAIIGFSDLMLQAHGDNLTDRQRRYVQNILDSGQHLLEIVNDVLDIAKADAARLDVRLGRVTLGRVIAAALSLVRPQAEAAGLTLEDAADGNVVVLADELRLRQVLLNLLSNAVKFTPAGGRVAIHSEQRGDMLEVAVSDTGIGIDAQHLSAVFDEFVQVSHGTDRAYEGTGLGLPLVRRLITAMGGGVRVDSTPGAGSVFTVWIPMAAAHPPEEVPPAQAGDTGRKVVLVVDDDPMVREFSVQVLADAGYDVAAVGTVAAAQQAIAERPPQVVVLDLLLDGEHGEELLAAIRALSPKPAVLILSIVDPDSHPLADDVQGWLVKPVRPDTLRAAVAAAVGVVGKEAVSGA